jgi:hypothetical protein
MIVARRERPMRRAVIVGARRAGLHLLRAGYEVVAGAGAFLDEVVRVRRAGEEAASEADGPTRIAVD